MNKTQDGESRTKRRLLRRHSLAERTALIGEYRASGLTLANFATRAGMKIGTLRTWLYREKRPLPRVGGSHFAPVRVLEGGAPLTQSPGRGAVTVRWPQGIEVEITLDLDTLGAGHLLRALLSPCL